MPGTEIGELDLLLHLARALPLRSRLRIHVLSLLDAELAGRLERLRRERSLFEAEVRPGLRDRLRRRLAHASAAGTASARPRVPGLAAAARDAWAHAIQGVGPGLRGTKAVYLWVALSTLTIAALLLSPLQDVGGRGPCAIPVLDDEGRCARPPLILGY